MFAECHIHEAGIGVGLVFQDDFLDACSRFGVFCHHVEETASTSSWELVAQAEVVDELGEGCNVFWIGATVECLVLQPVLTEQIAHVVELLALDGFVHVECQLFHVAQMTHLLVLAEEHVADDFCKDFLGSARDARVVE